MSFEYYSKWWAVTKKTLKELALKDEDVLKKIYSGKKTIKDRKLANKLIGGLYTKYCVVVKDLGTILDQMAQPQERMVVRKIMDAATVRLHELNEELRNIDLTEFHYVDGNLIELKLVPQDVEILDPILYYLRDYTLEDLWTKIKNGEKIYTPPPPPPPPPPPVEPATDEVQTEETQPKTEEAQPPPAEEKKVKKRPQKFVPETKVLTKEEMEELKRKERITNVVKMIQIMERGRQARLYFIEKFNQAQYRKKIRGGFKPEPEENKEIKEKSATEIQKYWRGHSVRNTMKCREKQRQILIGMVEPNWKSHEEFDKFEENLQRHRDLRDQRIKEYIEANLNEKTRVFKVIGPRLFEDIGDEIREWFRVWYDEVKNFDKIPPEEKGGTILVVRGETLTPKEWIDDVENKRRAKAKEKGKDKAKLKADKLKKKKEEAEKKKKEKEKAKKERQRKMKKRLKPWDYELELEPTLAKDPLHEAYREYYKIFHDRKIEDNPLEKTYMDIIHEEKCYEMQLEIRKQVDELMRLELEMLEDALLKDRARAKGKKYKKKKQKKKKHKKKHKKKGPKDITANRATEDLFQELVDNGIIHPYKEEYLKDYKGDLSYKNFEVRDAEFNPPPCMGDLRQVIKINCIAPLSTESMKKPKSVLLIGPDQTGKHLLANAVFTESHSVLFDLSAEILAGKYPGKKGMKMLVHLINKMSRLLQPSVIYFDGAERVFYKKVPKAEKELEPKRIGKILLKGIIKNIKPEDKVMVLGISRQPWLGSPAKMKKTFERIILIPRPDYGTVYLYWRELLMAYHGVDRNFDVSSLAKVTEFYPLPELKKAAETVLTPRRIIKLSYEPLKPTELYEVLINVDPITDKEYSKFLKFYGKIPLAKERRLLDEFYEKKREEERKKQEKMMQQKEQ